jgi:hypothetical protein
MVTEHQGANMLSFKHVKVSNGFSNVNAKPSDGKNEVIEHQPRSDAETAKKASHHSLHKTFHSKHHHHNLKPVEIPTTVDHDISKQFKSTHSQRHELKPKSRTINVKFSEFNLRELPYQVTLPPYHLWTFPLFPSQKMAAKPRLSLPNFQEGLISPKKQEEESVQGSAGFTNLKPSSTTPSHIKRAVPRIRNKIGLGDTNTRIHEGPSTETLASYEVGLCIALVIMIVACVVGAGLAIQERVKKTGGKAEVPGQVEPLQWNHEDTSLKIEDQAELQWDDGDANFTRVSE